MATLLPPLVLIHTYRKNTDDRDHLCDMLKPVLRMSKGEVTLLKFYAKQTNGFRPSAQYIANSINVSRMQVFRLRDKLIDHGLAAKDNKHLFINWDRIRLFSTLDPAMTGKNPYIKKINIKKCYYKDGLIPFNFLEYGKQEQVVKYFSAIDEKEYAHIRYALLKKQQREAKYGNRKCYYKETHFWNKLLEC